MWLMAIVMVEVMVVVMVWDSWWLMVGGWVMDVMELVLVGVMVRHVWW